MKDESIISKFRRTFGEHPVAAADLRRDNPELARRMAEFLDANKDQFVREVAGRVGKAED